MRPSKNLENKTLSDTYSRVLLVCRKVQAHSSLEPPLEYNQNQKPLVNQGSFKDIFKDKHSFHEASHCVSQMLEKKVIS